MRKTKRFKPSENYFSRYTVPRIFFDLLERENLLWDTIFISIISVIIWYWIFSDQITIINDLTVLVFIWRQKDQYLKGVFWRVLKYTPYTPIKKHLVTSQWWLPIIIGSSIPLVMSTVTETEKGSFKCLSTYDSIMCKLRLRVSYHRDRIVSYSGNL